MRGKDRDFTINEIGKVLENQWRSNGMLASTNEVFFSNFKHV